MVLLSRRMINIEPVEELEDIIELSEDDIEVISPKELELPYFVRKAHADMVLEQIRTGDPLIAEPLSEDSGLFKIPPPKAKYTAQKYDFKHSLFTHCIKSYGIAAMVKTLATDIRRRGGPVKVLRPKPPVPTAVSIALKEVLSYTRSHLNTFKTAKHTRYDFSKTYDIKTKPGVSDRLESYIAKL